MGTGKLRAYKSSRNGQVRCFGRLTELALFRPIDSPEKQDVLREDGISFARIADVRDLVEDAGRHLVLLHQALQPFAGELHTVQIIALQPTKNGEQGLVWS